jgi:hypothetical protein
MKNYAALPLLFLKFWYIESPSEIFRFFWSLNSAFFHLFSLPLLLKTYFQPIKNEYRQGLVGFSRAMGIAIKSVIILVDFILLILLLAIEISVLAYFLFFPALTIGVIFL